MSTRIAGPALPPHHDEPDPLESEEISGSLELLEDGIRGSLDELLEGMSGSLELELLGMSGSLDELLDGIRGSLELELDGMSGSEELELEGIKGSLDELLDGISGVLELELDGMSGVLLELLELRRRLRIKAMILSHVNSGFMIPPPGRTSRRPARAVIVRAERVCATKIVTSPATCVPFSRRRTGAGGILHW